MENLNKDVLFLFAIKLDLRSLINFCNCSSKINEKICKNNIWLHKLKEDFPDYENNKFLMKNIEKLKELSAKNRYIAIYKFLDKNKGDDNMNEFYNLITPKLIGEKEAIVNIKKILYIIEKILIWKEKSPYVYLSFSWVSKNSYLFKYEKFKIATQNKIKEAIRKHENEEEWNDFLHLLDI